MKGTEQFKAAIQKHLDWLAAKDPLFSETLKKPNKNIEDCTTYILNRVKDSGMNGFADDEIFEMAVHYYDEDNIDIGKPVSGRVVVNHTVELTDEEKQQAKQKALDMAVQEEKDKLKPKKQSKKTEPKPERATLFD